MLLSLQFVGVLKGSINDLISNLPDQFNFVKSDIL